MDVQRAAGLDTDRGHAQEHKWKLENTLCLSAQGQEDAPCIVSKIKSIQVPLFKLECVIMYLNFNYDLFKNNPYKLPFQSYHD